MPESSCMENKRRKAEEAHARELVHGGQKKKCGGGIDQLTKSAHVKRIGERAEELHTLTKLQRDCEAEWLGK